MLDEVRLVWSEIYFFGIALVAEPGNFVQEQVGIIDTEFNLLDFYDYFLLLNILAQEVENIGGALKKSGVLLKLLEE